ncbi:MAG TPA: hypothetical protein VNP72_10540 [Longimicrobium sp.]|nr:hypothetical protein [Longimicrobium sp.]
MSPQRWRPSRLEVAIAVTFFGVAFLAASSGAVPIPAVTLHWRTAAPAGYAPSFRAPAGREMAFVFIGASHCTPSNHESLPPAVERLKLLLRDRAARSGRSFTTLGIARDWSVDAGLAHLGKFGLFDEVVAGRNWLNVGLLRYVWEDVPGQAATPQVLVLDRRLVDRGAPEAADGVVQDERLVTRLVGWEEIERWAARGAPLPRLPRVVRADSAAAVAEAPRAR